MPLKELTTIYLRNFVLGVEDSLISTVGLLSGIASADVSKETIIITGIILILVESFSMAVGSFFSEHSVEEYKARREISPHYAFIGSLIMFFSYLFSGFIPLGPYFFIGKTKALQFSILFSLLALFSLGAFRAKISKIKPLSHGLTMMIMGGITIIAGIIAGRFLEQIVK